MHTDTAEFFPFSTKKIYEHLLSFNPSPHELNEWLSSPETLDRLVAGTSMEIFISKKASAQRLGILRSLEMFTDVSSKSN